MKKLVIYGKEDCGQCTALVNRLKSDDIPYTYLKLDEDYDMKDLMTIKPAAVRQFPMPFIVDEEDGTTHRYIKPDDVTIMDDDIATMVLTF